MFPDNVPYPMINGTALAKLVLLGHKKDILI